MRKIVLAAAALSFIAFSASAASVARTMKVKIENPDGSAVVVTFKPDGTSVDDKGNAGTYTFDEATMKLCGTANGETRCGKADKMLSAAGDTGTLTDDKGGVSKSTVLSVE